MEIIVLIVLLLLCILFLLSIPVEVIFHLNKNEKLEYKAHMYLLFGLLRIDMKKLGDNTSPKKQKRGTSVDLRSLSESKRFIKRLVKLLRDLVKSLQVKGLSMYWEIGLEDPADTGILSGILQPILIPWENATLRANFHEEVFEGYCKAHIRFFPIKIIGYFIAFLFSCATINMMRNALKR